MGKQKSLIRLKGNLGGISFYKSGGEDLARMAEGPDKNKLKNSPAYARVRENNREFGGAANAGKAFRTAFATVTKRMGDHYFSARLTQLFKKMCLAGPGVRGEREIRVTEYGLLLQGMNFDKALPLSALMNAPYTLTVNAARNEATLAIPDIAPQHYLGAPTGATHFNVLLALGMVSNFAYDEEAGMYLPTDQLPPETGALGQSGSLPLQQTGASYPVNIAAAFTNTPTPGGETAVIAAIGVEFYQQVNGVDYLLAQNNAMQVVKVV